MSDYEEPPKRSPWLPFLVFAGLVVVVGGGIAVYSAAHPGAISSPVPTHSVFRQVGRATCIKKITDDRTAAHEPVMADKVDSYCTCAMNDMADTMTDGDLRSLDGREEDQPPAVKAKMQKSIQMCLPRLQ